MGTNRVGLARTQALIENLKRELTTFPGAGAAGGLNTTALMTAGTGVTTGTGTLIKHSVLKVGNIIYTSVLIDLTGLSSNVVGDIIGVSATANCHLGQITAAVNGTLLGGRMTNLETIAGGEPDIDLYSANEATGTEDTAITDLTETELLSVGADWTMNGGATTVRSITTMPPADDYLYLVGGGGTTDAVYTAGRFLIEFWGYVA